MSTLSGGPNIVVDGLVLALDAANTKSYVSGSTAWRDLSRSGNNGTLINGPTFNTGSSGGISFDGTNDYVEISDNPSLNFGTGDFTVICWVGNIPIQQTASGKGIIWKGSRFDGNIAGWSMAWDNQGYLYFIISSSSSRLERTSIPVNLFAGGWNGYRMVGMQRSGGSWRQINAGVVTTLGTFTGNVDNNLPIYLARNGAYNTYLNNMVSNVTIYNRALSAQEILQNYNATKTRFGL
jgi:hypothetical protein